MWQRIIIGPWLFPLCLSAQPLPPYPDNSPTISDWQEMDVKSVATPWSAATYTELYPLLDQLLALDKTTLPRADSPYSGALFDRLTVVDSLIGTTEATWSERLLAYQRLRDRPERLLLLYFEPNRTTQRFGREVLRLFLFELEVRQAGAKLLAAYDEAAPQAPLPQSYLFEETQAYRTALESCLYVLEAERAAYAAADLHDFAQRLYFLLSDAPRTQKRLAAERLQPLFRSCPDPVLARILKDCYRRCQ